MRLISMFAVAIALMQISAYAQFKSQTEQQPAPSQTLVHPQVGLGGLLGFFNPDRFSMHHSFSASYFSTGGRGLSLTSYTNSTFYQIADPLNLRFDITLQGSPFGQYGYSKQSDFSKLYLSRAELNYRPWENLSIKVEYNQLPFGYFGRYYPYSSWFGREE